MAAHSFSDLARHVNHNIVCVPYGDRGSIRNVAIKCEDCNEVLLGFDRKDGEFIVGDKVVVDDPRYPGDNWEHSFIGTVTEIHRDHIVVKDQEDNAWNVDSSSLTLKGD